jgi:hypothetical protein
MMFSPPPKRDQPSLPVETVDFGDLRVQQLGSIYEGLMEHHFHRDAATLKLVADKAERRQTGTYYTPDYIVKYIVDQTLRPLLDEIEASEPVKSARAAARQDNSFADAVLGLNVCDPAMGSGHFLVEGTAFLADQIVYHPTTKFQATRERGVPQEQTEIAYWRRRVVESCTYGVDLNPLAVELAKLSLWLTTIATDQPLNFLDHHLRCGNSLIGARIDQLGALPERKKGRARPLGAPQQAQFTFGPDFQRVINETIGQIHSIEERASTDVDAVKEKEKRWQEKVLPALASYKAVADLWTSTFFGHALDPETYLSQAQQILAGHKIDNEPARTRRFFHWELEFPEVFFNHDGSRTADSGFDVVLGNPPYGMPNDRQLKAFAEVQFQSAEGRDDLYKLFTERAAQVSRVGGLFSYIVSNTFLSNQFDAKLRRLLLTTCRWRSLVTFGVSVFPDPTVHTAVFVIQKQPPAPDHSMKVSSRIKHPSELAKAGRFVEQANYLADRFCLISVVEDREAELIVQKLGEIGAPLGELAYIRQCIKTGDDATYLRTSETPLLAPWKRVLSGSDVSRYHFFWPHRYLKYGNWLARNWQNPGFFERPKLVVRETSERITAAYEPQGYYLLSTLYSIYFKEQAKAQEDLLYLLALFNSKMAQFYMHHLVFGLSAGAFIKARANHYARLPIRRIEFSTSEKERAGLVAKAKQLVASGRNDEALRFVEQQLTAKPERSDVVHDLLAFLAQEMARLNAEQRAAARGFIIDLKDFHGVDADALTPKTRLDEFWKLDAAELFAHLRKNARRLAEQNVRLTAADEEKIRERFTRAKETIVPLEAQIAATDALIDQIVYRLYGLSAEEIALVERG